MNATLDSKNGHKSAAHVIAAAVLTALAATASADQDLADRFGTTQVVTIASLPPLGSVPTFFVNVDPLTLADFLRQDREQGRRFLSKDRPSLLEPFISKQKFLPVGSSSGNGFSQGNQYICITSLSITIPAWNSVAPVPASYDQPAVASRACSANSPWMPVTRTGTAINALYANSGVKVLYNSSYKVQTLIPTSQMPSAVQSNPEPAIGWGTAFFDTNGIGGKLQEVVWINASYSVN